MLLSQLFPVMESTRIIGEKESAQRPITATPQFQQWFAGSKAVDAQGNPLVLYHGTSKDTDFKSFKVPKNGVWFTPDSGSASEYANQNDSQNFKWDSNTSGYKSTNTASRVIPVYLKIVNPKRFAELPDELKYAENYKRAQGLYFDRLRSEGYDSVIIGNDVYVLLDYNAPGKIKSAIGNRDFSMNKKNIHENDFDHIATLPEPKPGLERCTAVAVNAIIDFFDKPPLTSTTELPKTAEDSFNLLVRHGLAYTPQHSDVPQTIKQFVQQHPKGAWYVGVESHAMAVVDGELYDAEEKGLDNRLVVLAAEVTLPGVVGQSQPG